MNACNGLPDGTAICASTASYFPCFRSSVSPVQLRCDDDYPCITEPSKPYSLKGCLAPPPKLTPEQVAGISLGTIAMAAIIAFVVFVLWRRWRSGNIAWIKKRSQREEEREDSGISLLDFSSRGWATAVKEQ
ncbi:hypothetical protein BCR33DRAFT_716299 [Rhizoclosmatium globosum]|uniref:Uncharacterized protein n=1 Tax=Rhizoclosmatium globosum TaxID=329046 RepID=A0A1Y2CF13_9FUNG|nr:hypothetical protein BCR33DRAFT_716299 [Rhizoclosmatium globosum]|eukprot:ORY45653.1 hypothetical protein BCR33DRAFT_716299 [Rhizoclosmatium globosum]